MKFTLIFLLFTIFFTTILSQQEDSRELEENGPPRKILRKYRVRRPVTIDANGNTVKAPLVVPPNSRLRRIRVKPQQPEASPKPVVVEATPEALLTARYGGVVQNTIGTQQIQQIVEPQIVEPIRVVPQYRTATSTETRSALLASVNLRERNHEDNKKPNVGTTRNYSHVNEDGSFTFGYEAEDGSFKEETRGIDCVARGKYGYVDPDGVRREFTYVSGNPCDPNDPNKDDNDVEEDSDEVSAPPSSAGLRALIRRPINTDIGQGLEQTIEERIPDFQVARRQRIRPQPQIIQQNPIEPTTFRPFNSIQPTTFRPRIRINQSPSIPTTTLAPDTIPEYVLRAFPQFRQSVVAPEPVNQSLDETRSGSRTVDFDQELQKIGSPSSVIHYRGQPVFTQQQQQSNNYQSAVAQQQGQQEIQPFVQHHPIHSFPTRQVFGGRAANQIFQNTPTPSAPPQFLQARQANPPQQQQQQQPAIQYQPPQPPQQQQQEGKNNYGSYRTELVYDPTSGQYTSVLVQDIPRTNEEITLTQRLRAFADPQQPTQQPQYQILNDFGQQQNIQYYQQPQQYLHETSLQEQQQQQQQQQFQRQPLFQAQSQFTPQNSISQPIINHNNSPASGQIDAFLRNLNLG